MRICCEIRNLQLRKSGGLIFTSIAVAELLADMQLDVETLITALLHDTVEDCDVTSEDIYTHFGYKIAELVNGVTNLARLKFSLLIPSKQRIFENSC